MVSIFNGLLSVKAALTRACCSQAKPQNSGMLFHELSDTLASTGEAFSFKDTIGRIVYGVNVASK